MLLPKRVKYRRVHRGRLKGKATRGNFVSHGEFGLMATAPSASARVLTCWKYLLFSRSVKPASSVFAA